MYWIEICTDGSYVIDGQEYPLLAEGIEQQEPVYDESSMSDSLEISIPFELETEHGLFAWEVDVIEYRALDVASFLGYRITEYPSTVFLKDEVMFRIQDGWANPRQPSLDLKPRMTKMRLA